MLNENGKRFFLELHTIDVFQKSGICLAQSSEQENHLIYIAEGSCMIQTATKSTRVMSRSLVYLRRNVQYTFMTMEGSPVLIYRLHFLRSTEQQCLDLDRLGELYNYVREFMAHRSSITFLVDCEDMYVTINELINEMGANMEEKNQMITSLMTILYIKMARSFRTHGLTSGITYINDAKRYIGEHYAEDLSIAKIADHLGISRSYLEIIFSKFANRKLTTHINTVRADKAAYFLTTTKKGILDVALAVGYGNRQHFARMFRKRYEVSPSQYRKLHGKNKSDLKGGKLND